MKKRRLRIKYLLIGKRRLRVATLIAAVLCLILIFPMVMTRQPEKAIALEITGGRIENGIHGGTIDVGLYAEVVIKGTVTLSGVNRFKRLVIESGGVITHDPLAVNVDFTQTVHAPDTLQMKEIASQKRVDLKVEELIVRGTGKIDTRNKGYPVNYGPGVDPFYTTAHSYSGGAVYAYASSWFVSCMNGGMSTTYCLNQLYTTGNSPAVDYRKYGNEATPTTWGSNGGGGVILIEAVSKIDLRESTLPANVFIADSTTGSGGSIFVATQELLFNNSQLTYDAWASGLRPIVPGLPRQRQGGRYHYEKDGVPPTSMESIGGTNVTYLFRIFGRDWYCADERSGSSTCYQSSSGGWVSIAIGRSAEISGDTCTLRAGSSEIPPECENKDVIIDGATVYADKVAMRVEAGRRQLCSVTYFSNDDSCDTKRIFRNLTITNGGMLTHSAPAPGESIDTLVRHSPFDYYLQSGRNRKVDIEVIGNLRLTSGGSINVSGSGYAQGYGPGQGGLTGTTAVGGGFGGRGENSTNRFGVTYPMVLGKTSENDYTYADTDNEGKGLILQMGSGGYGAIGSGAGGGRIHLKVHGTLVVDSASEIAADGVSGEVVAGVTASAGGSGGAIYIEAGHLEFPFHPLYKPGTSQPYMGEYPYPPEGTSSTFYMVPISTYCPGRQDYGTGSYMFGCYGQNGNYYDGVDLGVIAENQKILVYGDTWNSSRFMGEFIPVSNQLPNGWAAYNIHARGGGGSVGGGGGRIYLKKIYEDAPFVMKKMELVARDMNGNGVLDEAVELHEKDAAWLNAQEGTNPYELHPMDRIKVTLEAQKVSMDQPVLQLIDNILVVEQKEGEHKRMVCEPIPGESGYDKATHAISMAVNEIIMGGMVSRSYTCEVHEETP